MRLIIDCPECGREDAASEPDPCVSLKWNGTELDLSGLSILVHCTSE